MAHFCLPMVWCVVIAALRGWGGGGWALWTRWGQGSCAVSSSPTSVYELAAQDTWLLHMRVTFWGSSPRDAENLRASSARLGLLSAGFELFRLRNTLWIAPAARSTKARDWDWGIGRLAHTRITRTINTVSDHNFAEFKTRNSNRRWDYTWNSGKRWMGDYPGHGWST